MFSWSIRRQLMIFALFAGVVGIVVGLIIYFFRTSNNPDTPLQPKDLVILWSRIFPVREGMVDIAALIENPNIAFRSDQFTYSIKLYDAESILVAVKEGTTFINPGEQFLIFEPGIIVQNRKPARAIVDIGNIVWEKTPPEPILSISVLRTNRLLENSIPQVEAVIKNQSGEPRNNIEASIIVWGTTDEVLGVSRTFIDMIQPGEEKNLIFTWPNQILGADRAEILLRTIPSQP